MGNAKMTPSPRQEPDLRQRELAEAAVQRAAITRQARNQTYRALVSLVAAVAKACGSPREALEMIRGELDVIERDVVKAEKKAARRVKGNTDLEDAGK